MYTDFNINRANGLTDYTFNLYDKEDSYFFGFIEILEMNDSYVITGQINGFDRYAEIPLFDIRKEKLRVVFQTLQDMILNNTLPLNKEKPIYILADETISKDAIQSMKLKRVPRYCGYYFI